MLNGFIRFNQGLALMLTVVGFSSCGQLAPSSSTQSQDGTCNLPTDQSGTLEGHWASVPIPVAIRQNDFTAAEQTTLRAAMDRWNDYFYGTQGIRVFHYLATDGVSFRTVNRAPPSPTSNICSQNMVIDSDSGNFSGSVVIYKQKTWPYSTMTSTIALTSFCLNSIPNDALDRMKYAQIEVNAQNFYASGMPSPDLQSVFMHEFGHLLGLDHSCEYSAATGIPLCSNSKINKLYLSAIMFPSVESANLSASKVTLNSNDQSRSSCLYTGYQENYTVAPSGL